ncbi:hypothetical protein SAMN05216263_1384 [Metapseudomonas otitidis]|nr:hypothetical protein SAMN05216263_1384 [Pseudomonas otitidis]
MFNTKLPTLNALPSTVQLLRATITAAIIACVFLVTVVWLRSMRSWAEHLDWAPIIGDPLTMIAGVMREPFWSFFLIVLLAKAARYLVLTVVALGIAG